MRGDDGRAAGCLALAGLALISAAVGLAFAPWAGLALAGAALVAAAACGDGGDDGEGE